MEKARKNLKEMSIVMLILAGLSFIKACVTFALAGSTLNSADYTDGAITVGVVILCIASLIFCLPEIYIGIRGIKIAKNPVGTKGHIVWAIILLVLSAIATVSAIVNIFQGINTSTVVDLANAVLDVCILILYINSAKAVQKAA